MTFNINTKVKILSKSIGRELENTGKKVNDTGYIMGDKYDGSIFVYLIDHDYFLPSDLIEETLPFLTEEEMELR